MHKASCVVSKDDLVDVDVVVTGRGLGVRIPEAVES
jgi:hypothetical protein